MNSINNAEDNYLGAPISTKDDQGDTWIYP